MLGKVSNWRILLKKSNVGKASVGERNSFPGKAFFGIRIRNLTLGGTVF